MERTIKTAWMELCLWLGQVGPADDFILSTTNTHRDFDFDNAIPWRKMDK